MGKLTITFVGAKNLVAADTGGTSDPFATAKLKLFPTGKEEVKTNKILKNLNPTWNETHNLTLTKKNDIVLFNVFDWDRIGGNDPLGNAEVGVETLKPGKNELTLTLKGVKSGQLIVVIDADFTGVAEGSIAGAAFDLIAPFDAVALRQRVEKGEILTANLMEGQNQYDVLDPVKYKGADKIHIFNFKEESSAASRASGAAGKVVSEQLGTQSGVGRNKMNLHCRDPKNKNLAYFTASLAERKATGSQKVLNAIQGAAYLEVKMNPSGEKIGEIETKGGDIVGKNEKGQLLFTIGGDPIAEGDKKEKKGLVNAGITSLKTAVPTTGKKFLIKVQEKDVGYILKKWGGVAQELVSDADNYHVQFPKGADPKLKIMILHAGIMLDLIHFEKGGVASYIFAAETIASGGANLIVDVSVKAAQEKAQEMVMDEVQGRIQDAAIEAADGKVNKEEKEVWANSKKATTATKEIKVEKVKEKEKEKDKDKGKEKDKDKGKDKEKEKGKDKDKKDKDKGKDKDKDKKDKKKKK